VTSKKEKAWLEEYLRCWNATEAARRAGYKWPNKMGPRKLAKFEDEIQERIDELVMSADEALVRLSELARGEWAPYIKANGSVDIAQMIEDDKIHLVHRIKDTKYGLDIEFCDMQRAIEKIGKAHGLFVDRQEITGEDGGPIKQTITEIIVEHPADAKEPVEH
jgi:phage terminase small subunit